MSLPHYTETSLSVCSANSLAFKQGTAYGPCLKFQKQIDRKTQSLSQARQLWQK